MAAAVLTGCDPDGEGWCDTHTQPYEDCVRADRVARRVAAGGVLYGP